MSQDIPMAVPSPSASLARTSVTLSDSCAQPDDAHGSSEVDADVPATKLPQHGTLGGIPYRDYILLLIRALSVRSYLEIGVNTGATLRTIPCPTIGVDPRFKFTGDVMGSKSHLLLFQMTSDEFFRSVDARRYFPDGIDLAFLDGLHQFEYLLRDIANTEKVMHPSSVILLHDCLPANAEMTERTHRPEARSDQSRRLMWTGDVWKVIPILRAVRPDLRITLLDCPPTGLVMLSNLDQSSHVLHDRYFEIVDKWSSLVMTEDTLAEFYHDNRLSDSRRISGSELSLYVRN